MKQKKYYFYAESAKTILSAMNAKKKSIEVSLDLNRTTSIIEVKNEHAVLDEDNTITIDQLKKIKKKDKKIFILEGECMSVVEERNDYYYKLLPTHAAPTIEISGVRMHRTKNYDPFIDAREKVSTVVKKGDRVLDTCGGLGYTAIWAKNNGAKEVMTVEYDAHVVRLREKNPWSDELKDDKITVIITDVNDYIHSLESDTFDSIIHDPPRFSLSGELYGREFYAELQRVLKRKGRLYHYTGTPYSKHQGNKFLKNTIRRLGSVGFRQIRDKTNILGVTAIK